MVEIFVGLLPNLTELADSSTNIFVRLNIKFYHVPQLHFYDTIMYLFEVIEELVKYFYKLATLV